MPATIYSLLKFGLFFAALKIRLIKESEKQTNIQKQEFKDLNNKIKELNEVQNKLE
jgi:hypothetical protein